MHVIFPIWGNDDTTLGGTIVIHNGATLSDVDRGH